MSDNSAVDSRDAEKKAKREGDSWRAKTYRAKDEIMDFTSEDVRAVSSQPDVDMKPFHSVINEIHICLNALEANHEDQAAHDKVIPLMKEAKEIFISLKNS